MGKRLRVWTPLVRLLHWSLVSALLVSWLGTFAIAGAHQPAGYASLALVVLRVGWGCFGRGYARFAQFVRGPRATWAYLVAVLQRREPRHVGHNPLGAWMVLALLACVLTLGLTGWLYTTDVFWGDATVDTLHQALAWGLLTLAIVHVAGVLFTSHRQQENLIAAMFTGDKPESTETHGRG